MALHPKVSAGVVAGAIVSLIVSEANRRGLAVAPEEASSLTVLISFLTSYFVSGDEAGTVATAPSPGWVVPQPVVIPPTNPPLPPPAPISV
jgi:hypothetical protein